MDLAMDVGSEVAHHAAYCAQFWVLIRRPVEPRKALFNMVALLSGFLQAEIRK
jgi:hypothetical protein